MFCYEVNLEVQKPVSEAYAKWLPDHIRHVVELGEFLGADWWSQEGSNDLSLWTVRYYTNDRAVIDRYIELHAPKLRQSAIDLFQDKFKAERRIYKLNEIF